MKIRKPAASLVLALALATMTTQGGQFNSSQVPATAAWVAHADLDLLKATQVGQYILDQLNTEPADRKLLSFAAIFGFDPRKDLRSLTMFSDTTKPDNGTVLLDGSFDRTHLENLVRGDDHYQAHPADGLTIHSWIDQKTSKRMYGAIPPTGPVVIANELAGVEAALNVLTGKAPALIRGALANYLPTEPAAFFAAAANLAALKNADPKSAMFQNVSGGSLTLGEQAGNLHGVMTMLAIDGDAAAKLQQLAQGMIALGALNQQNDPKLAKLIAGTRCSLDGQKVKLTLDYPAADVVTAMKEQAVRQRLTAPGGPR